MPNTNNTGFGGSNAAVILEAAPSIDCMWGEYANGTIVNGSSAPYSNESTNGFDADKGENLPNGHDMSNDNRLHDERPLVTAIPDGSHPLERLFVFSAKSESSLADYMSSFREYLSARPNSISFATDLSFTLGQRRTHHSYRTAVTANSVTKLVEHLTSRKTCKVKDQAIAYVFTGQGAQ